jgi:precorrin-3B synthase
VSSALSPADRTFRATYRTPGGQLTLPPTSTDGEATGPTDGRTASVSAPGHYDVSVTANVRPAADRCPGLLRPHQAEDGLVIRLRIPGGLTTSRTLLALTELAGTLQLTSRGNIQLRGIEEKDLASATARIRGLGLLPSPTHELVRNIVASPLTGLTQQRPDVRALVAELDAAICAEPELADLPGRFLFAVDDGSADVWSLAFDIGYRALDESLGLVAVRGSADPDSAVMAGQVMSSRAALTEVVHIAVNFARARRSGERAWRIWELDDSPRELDPRRELVGDSAKNAAPPLGAVAGAACVGVPLGFLTLTQAAAVHEAACGGPVVVSPWRSLIIPAAAARTEALRQAGLVTDSGSPWSQITACVGAPGCGKSFLDTRQLAVQVADRDPRPTRPLHISGCERRCGAPVVDHDELVGSR